jgi:hypothetical protein
VWAARRVINQLIIILLRQWKNRFSGFKNYPSGLKVWPYFPLENSACKESYQDNSVQSSEAVLFRGCNNGAVFSAEAGEDDLPGYTSTRGQ